MYQSRNKSHIVDYSEGIRIYSKGSSYIDAISGMFNLPFGYSFSPIKSAIIDKMETLPFHPKDNFYTQDVIDVSNSLLRLCNMDNGATLFLNSGSEAIEASLDTALKFHIKKGNPNKKKIISRRHSYHGATLGAHSVSGRNAFKELRHSGYEVLAIKPPFDVLHNGIFEKALSLQELEDTIISSDPDTIAAFIFEPINHLKGMHICSKEYICGVRHLCNKYNILMITDEIVTGAFRSGEFLNTLNFGIVPDIVALGKGISGGYISASVMVSSSYISDAFEGDNIWKKCSYSHTYASSPVSLIAIKTSLFYLEKLFKDKTIAKLADEINNIGLELLDNPAISRVQNSGVLLGLSLKSYLGEDSGKIIEKKCFENGVIVRGEENWVCIVPSYITTMDELKIIINILKNTILDLHNECQ